MTDKHTNTQTYKHTNTQTYKLLIGHSVGEGRQQIWATLPSGKTDWNFKEIVDWLIIDNLVVNNGQKVILKTRGQLKDFVNNTEKK